MDPSACNYDEAANVDGTCDVVSCYGCTDPAGCNYDASVTIDDGSCDLVSCYGCTDPAACNYNEAVTIDDGSRDLESCYGCTDAGACNFDETATLDDGNCDFETCLGCTGGRVHRRRVGDHRRRFRPRVMLRLHGPRGLQLRRERHLRRQQLRPWSCYGSTAWVATTTPWRRWTTQLRLCVVLRLHGRGGGNYDATATFDDGPRLCDLRGCTYPGACNFSAEATEDDGSCDFSRLLTGAPTNAEPLRCGLSDDGSCLYVGCMDLTG